MKRWLSSVAALVALLGVCTAAQAKPAPRKAPAAPLPSSAKASAAQRAQAARARANTAREQATRARKQAQCLTNSAAKVDQVARRLKAAQSAKGRQTLEPQLHRALSTMDKCYDSLFDGKADRSKPTVAATPRKPQRIRSQFGFGQIQVEGGNIAPKAVAKPLRRQAKRLNHCYAKALRRAPQLEGTVGLRLHLTRRNRQSMPSSVAVPQGTMGDRAVRQCLAKTLMATHFPLEGHGATVSLMMAFAREAY